MLFAQSQGSLMNYVTIPEIAIMDIEPNTADVILEFNAPSEPGAELLPIAGDTKWLNYTATRSIGATFKEITAQISNGTQIPGLTIELVISAYQGSGEGELGTTVGSVNLSPTAQTIIYGIGGCYTGTGNNYGHEIQYNARITDYTLFEVPASSSLDILFTIGN